MDDLALWELRSLNVSALNVKSKFSRGILALELSKTLAPWHPPAYLLFEEMCRPLVQFCCLSYAWIEILAAYHDNNV